MAFNITKLCIHHCCILFILCVCAGDISLIVDCNMDDHDVVNFGNPQESWSFMYLNPFYSFFYLIGSEFHYWCGGYASDGVATLVCCVLWMAIPLLLATSGITITPEF